MFAQVSELRNRFQFFLRERYFGKLKLRRGLPRVNSEETPEDRFYRLVISKALGLISSRDFAAVWDVGCRNWSYAKALALEFPNATLHGIELDGGRRYWNLYRRQDAALAQVAQLRTLGKNAKCTFLDFKKIDSTFGHVSDRTLFCFFFPFVSPRPCARWGLPIGFADYASLLSHTRDLARDACILSIHQGEWEAELAEKAYRHSNMEMIPFTISPEEYRGLWPSNYPIYGFVTSRLR